jgi:uncharacterized protein (TIGR00730 family)
MEAANKGAFEAGGTSIGLHIKLHHEAQANPFLSIELPFKHFVSRKSTFFMHSLAYVVLPGGFGTLDETLEVLTLLQTGKQTMFPLILLDEPGGTFWSGLETFFREQLLSQKLISPEDIHLYLVTDSNDAAIAEILTFYRNYHSLRYVNDMLVIRMTSKLKPGKLAALNDEFSGILVSGKIEQRNALSEESNEPEIENLPRLLLHFNRRNLGRLRQLINRINDI